MEIEIRFYFSIFAYEDLISRLQQQTSLNDHGSFYEKTLLFDNPNPTFTFYSKEVDGRFRIRISKHTQRDDRSCKISWKKRLSKSADGIHTEEEVELPFAFDNYSNLMVLVEDVLKMPRVESYERYRHVFVNTDVEICVDRFPFGIALEIEQKENSASSDILMHWVKVLGLDIRNSYKLSCDDKYRELCASNNKIYKKDILFDDTDMPKIQKE